MTPTASATTFLTPDEFLAKYGDRTGVELIRGRVVWAGEESANGESAVPKFRHGVACVTASRLIGDYVAANDLGWVASNDTFVRTNASVRGADVLFVSYAKIPKGKPPEDLTVAPELVVEVRSPTDKNADLFEKIGEYLAVGVTVVLVLDPRLAAATVYRNDELPQVMHNGDELTIPDVLPGFVVPVRKFFE